ncbi:hypothetical protein [Cellulomonas aerilata]|uniref:Uncharacterized protein n=1 Tax=Cellulomonas aerilata TaxID=515326 RepID=A0A512DC57_9CELL|nr:hypothetical protein [Cellulomonas aerilata]GEO34072.1 hypothetical protein CAE01nite_17970 [Cellulomonas aerilata]
MWHSRRAPAAVAVALAMAGTGTALAPTAVGAVDGGAVGRCEVHTLALPDGVPEGLVVDVELVRGRGVVYYGSTIVVGADGEDVQQPVVWFGLQGEPVPVGPEGSPTGVAFELTPSGLINGQSINPDTGRWQGWVQKLLTGRVTWVDPGPGDVEPAEVYFRRINDRGAAAGTAWTEDGGLALRWTWFGREPVELPGGDEGIAEGWDINNHRDVVGVVAVRPPGEEDLLVPRPTLWDARNRPTPMATVGLDGYAVLLNDRRQAAGAVGVGPDFSDAHAEAAFWETPDSVVGLGVVPGGVSSAAYGLGEDGWVVGVTGAPAPDAPANPDDVAGYGFLWPGGDPTSMRILPSPYALEHGLTDWRQWFGGAAHGVNERLRQVGTASHGGYLPDGRLMLVPTVYVNADRCGTAVPTSHTPAVADESTSESFAVDARSAAGTSPAHAWSSHVGRLVRDLDR